MQWRTGEMCASVNNAVDLYARHQMVWEGVTVIGETVSYRAGLLLPCFLSHEG